jgi:tagaturonate reductase
VTLPRLDRSRAERPELLDLPVRAVQFGTGAFLRGFIDYFIDEANRQGLFGGRIVAIGSTGSGRDRFLNEQDGLYTLAIRGVEDGQARSELRQIASVSAALPAATQWDDVLALARTPGLELIFSNTTETGIRIDEGEAPGPGAPRTFPGKLTRFLFERARHFDFSTEAGVVVLPCELIENNGGVLASIVRQLAERWNLGRRFMQWLDDAVPFCNTLVDRIVPGKPSDHDDIWQQLGYRDELLTACEVYRLFAIEATPAVAPRLTFAVADRNIIIARDISPYRERKLRLLNGTHTLLAPVGLAAGCSTVAEAVADERVGRFVRELLFGELVPSTTVSDAEAFARQVLERFANPDVRHALLDITLHQTLKLRVRIVPAILDAARRTGSAPALMALGFAAYLRHATTGGDQRADDGAARVRELWGSASAVAERVARVCGATDVWGTDLTQVPQFVASVTDNVLALERDGGRRVLEQHFTTAQQVRP